MFVRKELNRNMSGRFYVPHLREQASVSLTGPEAHHLLHVLRLKAGEQVCLFDGNGHEATAEIATLGRATVELNILWTRFVRSETQIEIILGTAVPKGDRFRWLIEKATELGIDRLIPLQTTRSVVDPRAGKIDKLRQTVIAASKQCGRARLMQLDEPMQWQDFVSRELTDRTAFVADPTGASVISEIPDLLRETELVVVIAIGPEGGLTDDELDLAVTNGARLINLGSNILRIETAAIAVAALFGLSLKSANSAEEF